MVKKFSLVSATLALLATGVSAESKSGLFVGVNAGVPITTADYSGGFKTYENVLPDSGVGYAVGIDVGYKQMFNKSVGLRYYVDYYFNQSFGSNSGTIGVFPISTDATISQHLVTANIDLLWNPTSIFGVYVGFGLGYQYYNMSMDMSMSGMSLNIPDASKDGFALPINVGVNFNLGSHHTIDIGAKLNTFGASVSNAIMGQNGTADLRTFIVKVGYNYTF